MSTSARLDVSELVVVAGAPASCKVLVANRGSIVEGYTLTVVGELAPYATVEPATLSLYPESEGSATVTITLPRDAGIEAGEIPFGVLVEPQEHPADTAVPEAVARVQAFSEITAELTPRTSHGSRHGRHSLAVDNRGNEPVLLTLEGKDPDAVMEFRFSPGTLEVPPNSAAFAKVRTKPLDRIWKGVPKTRQFSVTAALTTTTRGVADPLHGAPKTVVAQVDGMMVQDPVLPSWTGKAVAGLLAAAAVLAGLWFFVLKQAVESTAQDVMSKPLASVSSKAEEAKTEAKQANDKADEAQDTSKGTQGKQDKQSKDIAKKEKDIAAREAALTGQPYTQRWPLNAKPGAKAEQSYTVPKNKILQVTDVNFESQGSTAVLEIFRDDYSLGFVQAKNFRDIRDYHYVSPFVFTEGQKLTARLTCTTPAPGATECANAVLTLGTLVDKPKPVPTTTPTPTPGN